MIKALRIDKDLLSKPDFQALSAFLDLLGFQNESGESGKNENSVTFSAPVGKISFRWGASESAGTDSWDFAIEVDDPDTAFRLIRDKKYRIVSDLSEYQTGIRHLVVQVAPIVRVAVLGAPDKWMAIEKSGALHAKGRKFALVVSRFNSFITERLLQGALDGLMRLGAKQDAITIVRVPGSFEVPSAARTLAETKKYDAIICLGCLLRGDTAHYDVIVNEVARGIGQSAQETGVPHAFGVLTCDTLEQAIDRAGLKMGNKGFEAALAAVEMANLKKSVVRRSSSVVGSKKALGSQAPALRKTRTRKSTRLRKRSR
jgi:6,7-dimethyl-8-ribityllumazine synthase